MLIINLAWQDNDTPTTDSVITKIKAYAVLIINFPWQDNGTPTIELRHGMNIDGK